MKHMQDFREWLSAVNAEASPLQRHLAALTRLDRARLWSISSGLTWFQWGAPQPVGES
ncbi:MAG: hypothetical protein HY865_03105 [Chloroflexi bacterium]|nr:hypothetical protein [Chloroflexota bacterium]